MGLIFAMDARDSSTLETQGPGQAFTNQGKNHISPSERGKVTFNSNPPTSGPHVPVSVKENQQTLSNDQILHALELGNIVILYDQTKPPEALRNLANQVAGPFSPTLVQAGQAIILGQSEGTQGIVALAWQHLLRVENPSDPALKQFVEYWLGTPNQD